MHLHLLFCTQMREAYLELFLMLKTVEKAILKFCTLLNFLLMKGSVGIKAVK